MVLFFVLLGFGSSHPFLLCSSGNFQSASHIPCCISKASIIGNKRMSSPFWKSAEEQRPSLLEENSGQLFLYGRKTEVTLNLGTFRSSLLTLIPPSCPLQKVTFGGLSHTVQSILALLCLQDFAVRTHVSDHREANLARNQRGQRGQRRARAVQLQAPQRGLVRGWLPHQLHGEMRNRWPWHRASPVCPLSAV